MNKIKTYVAAGLALVGSLGMDAQEQKKPMTDGQRYNSVYDVDSTKYSNALRLNSVDNIVPMKEIVGVVLRSQGIKNPTRADSLKVYKQIHDNALRNSQPGVNGMPTMTIVNGPHGEKILKYNINHQYTKNVSVDEMRSDLNYTSGELAAAMGLLEANKEDCIRCDDTLEKKVNRSKKNSAKSINGLGIGGGIFHPLAGDNPKENFEQGYYATLVVPLGKLNLDLTYYHNVKSSFNELTRNVLDEYQSNSGRLFQDVEYVGSDESVNIFGGLGLSGVFNRKGSVPFEVGLKALGGTTSSNPFYDRREEVYFDENQDGTLDFIGEGTDPSAIVVEPGKSESGLIGGQAYVRAHIAPNVALEVGYSQLKNDQSAINGGVIFYLGKNK